MRGKNSRLYAAIALVACVALVVGIWLFNLDRGGAQSGVASSDSTSYSAPPVLHEHDDSLQDNGERPAGPDGMPEAEPSLDEPDGSLTTEQPSADPEESPSVTPALPRDATDTDPGDDSRSDTAPEEKEQDSSDKDGGDGREAPPSEPPPRGGTGSGWITRHEHLVVVISGVVVDPEGNPVAGASVRTRDPRGTPAGMVRLKPMSYVGTGMIPPPLYGPVVATTDSTGAFRYETAVMVAERTTARGRGGTMLWGEADGFGWSERITAVDFKDEGGKWEYRDVVIPLRPGGAITGRVVDEFGRGVEGIQVAGVGAEPVLSNREGEFQAGNIPEGTIRITAGGTGWRLVNGPETVTVRAGAETRVSQDFVVARTAVLAGRALKENGEPYQGFVFASIPEITKFHPSGMGATGTADERGEFTINLPKLPESGTYTIRFSLMDYEADERKMMISIGTVTDLGVVTFRRTTPFLIGTVRMPDGTPYEGAVFVAIPGYEHHFNGSCDTEGSLRINLRGIVQGVLKDGTYQMVLNFAEYRPVPVQVTVKRGRPTDVGSIHLVPAAD